MSHKYTYTQDLVAALEEGKMLEKDFKLAYEANYSNADEGQHVMYLFQEDTHGHGKYYSVAGWGSAIGVEKMLVEIFYDPWKWRVSKYTVEDRPWSVAFEKKMKEIKDAFNTP